jgi:ribosomal protein S18 acetylase RimI-like enzyme
MPILRSFTLTLLLASASVHAMEPNVEIVPFDRQKHHERVSTLLKQTFVSEPTISRMDTISVLVKKNKVTRRTPAETILGFISYQNRYTSKLSNNMSTIVKYLIIEEEYQGKGYGKLLMRHVADYARNNDSNELIGTAAPDVVDFYRKLGARVVNDKNPLQLSKNLSESK